MIEVSQNVYKILIQKLIFSLDASFSNHDLVILQVSRSSSVPQNTRDALYQGLPPSIKSAFRSKLQLFQVKEEV